jgi:dihydroorotase
MPRDIISKCAWSPFTGMTFSNKIYHTFVNGNHVVKEGKLIENSPSGQMLLFDR